MSRFTDPDTDPEFTNNGFDITRDDSRVFDVTNDG